MCHDGCLVTDCEDCRCTHYYSKDPEAEHGSSGWLVSFIIVALLFSIFGAGFWIFRRNRQNRQNDYENEERALVPVNNDDAGEDVDLPLPDVDSPPDVDLPSESILNVRQPET